MGKYGDETSVAEINTCNIYKLHPHHPGLCSGGVDYGFSNAGSSVIQSELLHKDPVENTQSAPGRPIYGRRHGDMIIGGL